MQKELTPVTKILTPVTKIYVLEAVSDYSLAIGVRLGKEINSELVKDLNHKGKDNPNKDNPNKCLSTSEYTFNEKKINKTEKEIKRIYVEDYSLDTCFSYFIFKMSNEDFNEAENGKKIELWLEYINNYEQGFLIVDEEIKKSLAVCYSAIMLAMLRETEENKITKAFHDCVESLGKCFRENKSPKNININKYFPSATSYISHEEMCAEYDIENGIKLQLLSPYGVSDSPEELTIIDALFTEEQYDSAAKKHIYRSYSKSWTKRGYLLWFVTRNFNKSGSKITEYTISTPGDSGFSFKKLWEKLEEHETSSYKEKNLDRPNDKPREGGFKFNDPWWDDNKKFTLLASPQIGSYVKVDDVRELIWKTHFLEYMTPCVKSVHSDKNSTEYYEVFKISQVKESLDKSSPKIPSIFFSSPTFEKYLLCRASQNKDDINLNQILNISEYLSISRNLVKYVVTKFTFAIFIYYKDDINQDTVNIYKALKYVVKDFKINIDNHSSLLNIDGMNKSYSKLKSEFISYEAKIIEENTNLKAQQNILNEYFGKVNGVNIYQVAGIDLVLNDVELRLSNAQNTLKIKHSSETRNAAILIAATVTAASISIVFKELFALYIDINTPNSYEFLNAFIPMGNPNLINMAETVSQYQLVHLIAVVVVFVVTGLIGINIYHKYKE